METSKKTNLKLSKSVILGFSLFLKARSVIPGHGTGQWAGKPDGELGLRACRKGSGKSERDTFLLFIKGRFRGDLLGVKGSRMNSPERINEFSSS